MKQLGYYAKDSQNNLFQFEWGANDEFYILNSDGNMEMTDPNKYQILEIGLFHDESNGINDVVWHSEMLAFKKFISETPQSELEYYSDEEFTYRYIKYICGNKFN